MRSESRAQRLPDAFEEELSWKQGGRRRIVIEGVRPSVEAGRYAIKRTVGERVVAADILADGHDVLSASLLYRSAKQGDWREAPMSPVGNDRWEGSFAVETLGRYFYSVEARVDDFATWLNGLKKEGGCGPTRCLGPAHRGSHSPGGIEKSPEGRPSAPGGHGRCARDGPFHN